MLTTWRHMDVQWPTQPRREDGSKIIVGTKDKRRMENRTRITRYLSIYRAYSFCLCIRVVILLAIITKKFKNKGTMFLFWKGHDLIVSFIILSASMIMEVISRPPFTQYFDL